jgi:two-component system, NtrC family, response regulator HupR/HoxA
MLTVPTTVCDERLPHSGATPRLYLIDDAIEAHRELQQELGRYFQVMSGASLNDAIRYLQTHDVSVLLIVENKDGLRASECLREVSRALPFNKTIRIVYSNQAPDDEAHKESVFCWLKGMLAIDDICVLARRGDEAYQLAAENRRLTAALHSATHGSDEDEDDDVPQQRPRGKALHGFESMVGDSPELLRVLDELARIRRSDVTLHIHGETGTGKELAARGVHLGSLRKDGPFIAQNCGGITESLLQSTLFGHERGAFTGADRSRSGVFQAADGGTLFLDEVGELSPAVQVSLLRALQEGEVIPVGATQPVRVNVRVVSATHHDLRELVAQGKFRKDLYFRLVVMNVRLPPLRERRGDIPVLAQHLLEQCCKQHGHYVAGFEPPTLAALEAHAWPGNVRELQNEVERLVILTDEGKRVPARHLSRHIRRPDDAHDDEVLPAGLAIPGGLGYDEAIAWFERSLIEQALQQSNGVLTRAAKRLGIERSRLGKIRARYGIKST